MSVHRAQQEIDSREFAHWMAFYQLEPWGRDVEDRPAALVATTIANVNRGRGKRPYQLNDFALKYGQESKKQTWEEQAEMMRNLTIAYGGNVH